MKKYYFPIFLIFAIVLTINLYVKPTFHKKQAVEVVKTVLLQWQDRDLIKAMDQWEDPDLYPTVYSLDSFRIMGKRFYKDKGLHKAKIHVIIDFSKENKVLPSGKEWIFYLVDGPLGWRVRSFHSAELEDVY